MSVDTKIADLVTAIRSEIDHELLYPAESQGPGAFAMMRALLRVEGKELVVPSATELQKAIRQNTYGNWHSKDQYNLLYQFVGSSVVDRQKNTVLAEQLPELAAYADVVAGVYRQLPQVMEALRSELAGEQDEGRLRQLLWLNALANSDAGFEGAIREIAPKWPALAPLVFAIPERFAEESQLPQYCSEKFRQFLRPWLAAFLDRSLQLVADAIEQALRLGDVSLLDAISAELDQFATGVTGTIVTKVVSVWTILPKTEALELADSLRSFARNAAQVARSVAGLVPAIRAEIEEAISVENDQHIADIHSYIEGMLDGNVQSVIPKWESLRPLLEPVVKSLADERLATHFIERIRPLHDYISAKLAVDSIVAAMRQEQERPLVKANLASLRQIDGRLERLAHVAGGKAEAFTAATAELRKLWPTLANLPDKWPGIASSLSYVAPYLIEQLRRLQADGAIDLMAWSKLPAVIDQTVTTMIGRVVTALHGEINRARHAHDVAYLKRIEQALSSLQHEWDQQRKVVDISADVTPLSLARQLHALAGVDAKRGAFFLEQVPALHAAVQAALPSDDEPQPAGFRQQHLLDFHLWDAAQQPVLSSLAQDGQMLKLGIRNTSRSDITLGALPAGDQAYHFILRFRKGTLKDPENIRVEGPEGQWIKVSPGPGLATPASDVQEIYLRGPVPHVIGAGVTRVLELHAVQADPGPGTRTTRVEFVYQSLKRAGRPLSGHREKTISVLNQEPPLQAAVYQLPLHVGFAGSATILNDDGKSANTLTLLLTNTGPHWRDLRFPALLPDRAKIILAFDVGDKASRKWGLATEDELAAIEPTLRKIKRLDESETGAIDPTLHDEIDPEGKGATWDVTFTSEAARPQWIFTPALQARSAGKKAEEQPITLATGQALELSITKITSSLPAGSTNLYLRCENVPGYPDRDYVLTVQKAPLVYGDRLVGIGTSEPSHSLHIAGNNAALRLTGKGEYGEGATLLFGDCKYAWLRHQDTDGSLTIHAPLGLALTGGNVGIGTTPDPQAKLQVAGDVKVDGEITAGSATFDSITGALNGDQITDNSVALTKLVAAVQQALCPVGTILPYAGDSAPDGWLMCNGARWLVKWAFVVNGKPVMTTVWGPEGKWVEGLFTPLYQVIGNRFGGGGLNDSESFCVPDLRGRFLRGKDAGSDRDLDRDKRKSETGEVIGAVVGSLQEDEFKNHSHGFTAPTGEHNTGSDTGDTQRHTGPQTAQDTKKEGGSETRPKNMYVNFIIKY